MFKQDRINEYSLINANDCSSDYDERGDCKRVMSTSLLNIY